MRNKYIVSFFVLVMLANALYFLPFTYLNFKINKQADAFSTSEDGNIDLKKKQEYLNSLWNKNVFYGYTYEQIHNKAIKFGLDLQGGMSFVVVVDIEQLIVNLAKKKYRDQIRDILSTFDHKIKDNTKIFVDEIEKVFLTNKLNFSFVDCFESKTNGISIEKSNNDDVKKYLLKNIEDSTRKSYDVVTARLNGDGANKPIINRLEEGNKIYVEIPGEHNEKHIKDILINVGELKFWIDSDDEVYNSICEVLNKKIDKDNIMKKNTSEKLKLTKDFVLDANDEEIIDDILKDENIKEILPDNIYICKKYINVKNEDVNDNAKNVDKVKIYFLQTDDEGNSAMNGDVISDARPTIDDHGKRAISLRMNSTGTNLWKNITGDNIGKRVVFTLDGKEIMTANIKYKITRGDTLISGNFTNEEAKTLSTMLKTGSLPTPIHIVEETVVGPGLSKSTQKQGLMSVLIAAIVLVIFLILFYGESGIIANISLLFNIIFILTLLAQINSVLTLVGIAGFILTLGMAIDANVLINERIKEELSIGKNIRAAIRLGYEKASGSIIDSNITTLLTGIILYLYGSGTIKSFSLTFIIGIVSSFFTAVYVSRLIFYIKEQSKSIKNMKFSLIFKGILLNTNFNFVRYRFFAYALSFILFCFGSFCFWKSKGFTYGIEFTGGYNIIVKLDKQVKSYDLEKFLVESLKEKINVKEYGSNSIFKMSMKAENLKSKENLMEKIKCNILDFLKNKDTQACEENNKENDVNDNVTFLSVERIEPSIAKDIIKNSSKAIIIVLLVLFLYIFIRFKKWQFSIVTILTLLHDMALIFAVYGISKYFGYTIIVNEIFIAAILTILGYTINNTIIIFDRIRENIRTNTDITFAENINKSVNVTLNRNLITTFSTLIVVIIIFMFGGITLEHFSFITLCGISLGTYSAIFISAPMLLDFVKKY